MQPGSDSELEVDHYKSGSESGEDEDFAKDGPKLDGNPEHETNKDGKLNDEPSVNDQGEKNCFVYIF